MSLVRTAALLIAATLLMVGSTITIAQSPTSTPSGRQSLAEKAHFINPAVRDYGQVVKLPSAVHQPRGGSKIAVDITKGNEPDQLNSAIEKVCRFLNIYAGAGRQSADVEIAVVLHGDATLSVLKPEAYRKRFATSENPNLNVLSELRRAGVQVYVCGQSLIGKGAQPEEVSEHADVAVSALTALVNLQSDGYAFIPLGN